MVNFYIKKNKSIMIVVFTAEVYPDPQLSSTSAAITSVTTTKKHNRQIIKKKKN